MTEEQAVSAKQAYKNRYLISAKLTVETYPKLMAYCREHNYSVNSAIRSILAEYFNV